jgi:hypothetical protein
MPMSSITAGRALSLCCLLSLMTSCHSSVAGSGDGGIGPEPEVDAARAGSSSDGSRPGHLDAGRPGDDAAPVSPDVWTADAPPPGDAPPAMPPPNSADDPLPPCRRPVPVATSADLATAIAAAQPGDCLQLADGSYTFPTISAKGTEAAPIVIGAVHLLKAVVSTGSLLMKNAAYVVVQGLSWTSAGTITLTDTDHGRISRFRLERLENGAPQAHDLAWITVFGASTYCRIDHSDFGPQNQPGNMILTTGTETTPLMATHTRIDHNHFHDVHFSGGNGWETIRSGADTLSYGSSFTLIEHNLFTSDANDPEIVSLKSSDNTLRYNTLRASKGQFNLRSGNRDIVYGNYVLGDSVSGSMGLRVGGAGHEIFSNYIEGVGGPGIFLEGGDIDEPSGTLPVPCTTAQCDPRFRVTKTDVVFNTVVNAGGIVLGGGGHPLDPADCIIAYNLVQGPGTLFSKTAGSSNISFTGNLGNLGTSSITGGVKLIDPKLMKVGDVYVIGTGSPAIDAGLPSFAYVTNDLDGKPRDATPDVGASEVSAEPGPFRLLAPGDVGPMAP